jgi:hypothetical protein
MSLIATTALSWCVRKSLILALIAVFSLFFRPLSVSRRRQMRHHHRHHDHRRRSSFGNAGPARHGEFGIALEAVAHKAMDPMRS